MLDIYPEFNTPGVSGGYEGSVRQVSAAYVEIQTGEGLPACSARSTKLRSS